MSGPENLRLPIDPADVPVEIYRVEPPKVLFNQTNGTVTSIHAAYREPETGDEIPVGAVVTKPVEQTMTVYGRTYTDNISYIAGLVGDVEIYGVGSPVHYYDESQLRVRRHKETAIAKRTRALQVTAAVKVLAHLGLELDEPKPYRRFFGRNRSQ